MLETDDDAPDFTLENQHGDPVTLSEIDAAYTVAYFYPRADTPGCTTEACGFRDEWDAFDNADVAVVGISDDPVADLADFAEKYELPFDLLSDPDGEVALAYDSYGEKNMFGNTFDGVFRNTYVVDESGEIVLTYKGVSPEEHAEEILEDIDSL
ncbi:peroxiredoxin [Halalkaliarchaeum desulfuricum]|uniref:thioredoxin-dependent peroxiredoxin n=1 Tax=Halalkaliarchaeum desulfuricum TaxID=2055893 RepID=A0A343TP15_9EURY|nr:thioredoxin-dependent thiol peroxidase [Halalkaliarchaeum desulfuricum]AUX10837.1 peroxiredoxin [Halalkaliarchaeum desulfuricum]